MGRAQEQALGQSYDSLDRLRNGFLLPSRSRSYTQQFASVYYQRLFHLRGRVVEACRRKWKSQQRVSRVLDIGPGKVSVVVGTVYCEMESKPNVLVDLAREHHIGPGTGPRKWVSSETVQGDCVTLEDESGRVRLVGLDRQKWAMVTGIIIGVMGRETSKGDFDVHDVVHAGPPPQLPLKSLSGNQGLVAILSGLDLDGARLARVTSRCEALVEWLRGEIGGPEEQRLARSVGRLIIAGNSVRVRPPGDIDSQNSEEKKRKRQGNDPFISTSLPVDHLDEVLTELGLPIDLIPGPHDPVLQAMPQQPLHRCLLPKANRSKDNNTLVNGPNPWWAEIGGATFLGTAGQNLDDVYKYVLHDNRLLLATSMLEWSHIAPTAPDTLWCYPFRDQDPFVLTELPRVYFIGNQPKFETELVSFPSAEGCHTRVILVPRFSKTGTIVLVNPVTLECHAISIFRDMNKDPNESDDEDDDNYPVPENILLDMDAGDDDEE